MAREPAPSRRDRNLRSLARRLLPVFALAVVGCLVMTGVLGQARTGLAPQGRPAKGIVALPGAPRGGTGKNAAAGSATTTAATTDGLSTRVGAVPGASSPGQSRWPQQAGQAHGASAMSARPVSPMPVVVAKPVIAPELVAGERPVPAARPVITARPLSPTAHDGSRLGRLHQADVLVVAPRSLPARLLASIRGMNGVVAAVPVDAGRIKIDGVFVNVLGVNPARFRSFAAGPTARSAMLWQNIAAGGMA